jgi:colicin import membrane protein
MASFGSTMSALSAVSPMLGTAAQFINAGTSLANSFGGSANDDLYRRQQNELDQLAAQQAANTQIAQQNADLKREEIAARADADNRRRQNALKRSVAKQRAQFGASGIGAQAGGSGEAVLLGLFDQSEEDKNEAAALDQLRFKALDNDLASKRTLNLLQAQQLKANQDLERAMM